MDELNEKNGPEVTTGEEAPGLDVPEGDDPAAPGGGTDGGSDAGGGGGTADPVLVEVADPEIEKADDEKAVAAEAAEPAKVPASKKSSKLKVVLLEGKDLNVDGKVHFLNEHTIA